MQKFGPRGLETLFCRFLRFFFLGTGVHPHPPPTTYWCQTNLKYDFWGLGTTWPHQPPKNAGWLAPWATAKGRTPWDGASPLAQGGPPPVALSTSYRGVNATSFEIFGARVARNKGIGEKFHHSWSGRVRCVGAPGRQSDRTGLLDFLSHQNMQTSGNPLFDLIPKGCCFARCSWKNSGVRPHSGTCIARIRFERLQITKKTMCGGFPFFCLYLRFCTKKSCSHPVLQSDFVGFQCRKFSLINVCTTCAELKLAT